MRLGDAVQITIGTTEDIEGEEFIYEELGYQKLAEGRDPVPWVQLSDGTHRYLVAQDEEPYRGITYFASDMRQRVRELEQQQILVIDRQLEADDFRATFFSPNDVAVTLIEQDPDTLPQLEPYEFPHGTFGEYSVPVADLGKAISFWGRLGFELLHESQDPYPWAIVGDRLLVLGLHQTDWFEQPTITYFAPDMGKRIAILKQEGFDLEEMAEESGAVHNAILRMPDEQQIFFFHGEV